MEKKPFRYIEKKQNNKSNPSKVLMVLACAIAFLLPYFLVKKFTHNIPNKIKASPISLAELEFDTDQNMDDQETNDEMELELIEESAKIVAENVIEKIKPIKNVVKNNEWQSIRPRPGDSMAILFKRLGLSAKNLHLILQKNPYAKMLTAIKPNQTLKFLINNNKLEQLVVPINSIQTLTIYREGAIYKNKVDSKKITTKEHYIAGIVKGSLYTTSQHLGIPRKITQQMTHILRKEIDFPHSVQTGDRFSIAYELLYAEHKLVGIGDIVAVSYTNRGKTAQAIRHISRNGNRDYYTPKGESFKKAFSRYPIKFSHISSTFSSSRYHPILHYRRAHQGIDLAAPIGTPIQATGDGVIATIGRHNGYGNMIEIKHDGTFSTLYGHMLRFAKGISKGSKVKRGQVIGYVGQTGLASGPHCHFELHVHHQPRNPTTTNLPTASPVPPKELAAFKVKTRDVFAHLKSISEPTYARKDSNKDSKTG